MMLFKKQLHGLLLFDIKFLVQLDLLINHNIISDKEISSKKTKNVDKRIPENKMSDITDLI